MATLGKTLLQYSGGQLTLLKEIPEWLDKAGAAEADDWEKALASVGCEHVDKFGNEGDRYDVYRVPGDGYFVEIWDVFRPVAYIVIDQVYDYLRFRVEFLKPLLDLSDRIDAQVRREMAEASKRSK